jgi:tellurite resistance protein
MSAPTATPLRFLNPGWFAAVMGWAGLGLAWTRAQPLMGDMASGIGLVVAGVAALAFVVLVVAGLLRLQRYPDALAADLSHPVRFGLVATVPPALILLATLGVALFGPQTVSEVLWWLGCALQLWVTLWVLSRIWLGPQNGGLAWPGVTPLLIVPAVGNVLAPLAGVPLGHGDWAAAQFGIGLMLWPLVLALLLVRVIQNGLWPERLLPSAFVLVAPPSVIGLSALQLGASPVFAQICWGMAMFCLLWAGRLTRRITAQPFGVAHWGASFPLAALASLTLKLATTGGVMVVLAPALLALASLVILALSLATWRGLRDGSLLAPEPAATLNLAPAQT